MVDGEEFLPYMQARSALCLTFEEDITIEVALATFCSMADLFIYFMS